MASTQFSLAGNTNHQNKQQTIQSSFLYKSDELLVVLEGVRLYIQIDL